MTVVDADDADIQALFHRDKHPLRTPPPTTYTGHWVQRRFGGGGGLSLPPVEGIIARGARRTTTDYCLFGWRGRARFALGLPALARTCKASGSKRDRTGLKHVQLTGWVREDQGQCLRVSTQQQAEDSDTSRSGMRLDDDLARGCVPARL